MFCDKPSRPVPISRECYTDATQMLLVLDKFGLFGIEGIPFTPSYPWVQQRDLDLFIAWSYRFLSGLYASTGVDCDDARHTPPRSERDLFDSSADL